jgi:hypothetical protein
MEAQRLQTVQVKLLPQKVKVIKTTKLKIQMECQ